ncbi:MAG TPA: CGNR zinc finger domain-containing protein [Gaiellaceae bacterium]|nr:CGNR zinc finger domain-containing protein [Gaiellaceae bacterium]
MSPRYDVPKAAPEPLREVQQFVNSVDLEHKLDWLPDWLDERGLGEELERARALREALRKLVLANNGAAVDQPALELVNSAAARLPLQLGRDGQLRVGEGCDALDAVVGIALGAMLDGSWPRLKACRNCCWSFYDYSPNRSATWCSMQLCGNRKKTRAYRSRRRASI